MQQAKNDMWSNASTVPDTRNTLSRATVEFFCSMCDHYTYIRMNLTLNGNHVFNCPNCGHKHYRVVQNGIITGERFNESLKNCHEIVPVKSACVPKSQRRVRGEIAKLREMEICGDLK